MAAFDVLGWLELYRSGDTASVTVEQPIPTGACWTRTSNRDGGDYRYGDRSGLLPYTPCPLSSSLGTGFPEKYVKKDPDGLAHVDLILKALKNNINKICNTMIDNTKPWAIDGCVLSEYPSTTFLNIQHTEDMEYPDADRFCYYGYKFETLCTGGGDDAWVDSTSEFAMVVETQLAGMKCAIAAEIDCYRPHTGLSTDPPPLSSLMELKTARAVESDRQQKNVQRFKFGKWWIQSFIVGIPEIVIGYWSGDGSLRSTQSIPTHELPSRALDGFRGYMRNQVWRPEQLLGFLQSVLEWMQGLLKMDLDRHYRFVYHPERKLIVAEVCEEGELANQIRAVLEIGTSHQTALG